jgi:hypothetical protein
MVDPKERILHKMLAEFQIEYDCTQILIDKQIDKANHFRPGQYPPKMIMKSDGIQLKDSSCQTEL